MSSWKSYFERQKIRALKIYAGAADDIDLEEYLSPNSFSPTVLKEPIPHILVDDFLLPEAYAAIENSFKQELARGFSTTTKDRSHFHAFDIDYDGYKFAPKTNLKQENPYRVFYSVQYNQYFSKIFKQLTTLNTSFALHHHPPGDRTGFVHSDFVDKYFDVRMALPNLVLSHGSDILPKGQEEWYFKEKRIIALLFYVGNQEWQEGDGGETGLYDSDHKTLVKKIAPKNNRLLAFHISQKSFHAFQGNKTPRNCIVQWFHLPDNAF